MKMSQILEFIINQLLLQNQQWPRKIKERGKKFDNLED